MSESTPSRTAVHEAAHAVVAAHYGFSVGVVRLTPDHPDHAGYFMSASFKEAEPTEWCVMLHAGWAAVRELCAEGIDPAWFGSKDRKQATELLEVMADDPAHVDTHLKDAERKAWALVHKHRDLIFAVASELDRRGVLDGADVREIIAAHQETR